MSALSIIAPLIGSLIQDAIKAEQEGTTKALADQVTNLEAERSRQKTDDQAFDEEFQESATTTPQAPATTTSPETQITPDDGK